MFMSNIVSFKTIYQAVLILVALMILAGISQAEGTGRRPGYGGEPTPVNVFIFVFDLDEVKTADQSFVANVFLEYSWQDPRLAHQDETDRVRPLHDVWNPRLLLINQQRVLKTIPEFVSIAPNGEVTFPAAGWDQNRCIIRRLTRRVTAGSSTTKRKRPDMRPRSRSAIGRSAATSTRRV